MLSSDTDKIEILYMDETLSYQLSTCRLEETYPTNFTIIDELRWDESRKEEKYSILILLWLFKAQLCLGRVYTSLETWIELRYFRHFSFSLLTEPRATYITLPWHHSLSDSEGAWVEFCCIILEYSFKFIIQQQQHIKIKIFSSGFHLFLFVKRESFIELINFATDPSNKSPSAPRIYHV